MIRLILVLSLLLTGCSKVTIKLPGDCPGTYAKHWNTPVRFTIGSEFNAVERGAIVAAANTWNDAMEGAVAIEIVAEGGFPIMKVAKLSGNQTALTSTWYRSGFITKVEMRFSIAKLDTIDTETTALHEFGHALGLMHTDGTVMDPRAAYREVRRDIEPVIIAQARCLY
jgi:hypothetical protein